MRPYQKDIEQLQEELGHHEYMAKNFRQECNAAFAEYFEKRSIEIQNAIAATKSSAFRLRMTDFTLSFGRAPFR